MDHAWSQVYPSDKNFPPSGTFGSIVLFMERTFRGAKYFIRCNSNRNYPDPVLILS